MIRVCVAGAMGAFGTKHLEALARIDAATVTSVVGGPNDDIAAFATARGIPHAAGALAESLARDDVDAVILATPTGLHADQIIATLEAGKHVLCEIPMADNLADAKRVVGAAEASDRVAMVDHVRRFNPSHQWLHRRFRSGELVLQHLEAETHFLRRTNTNARGEPRSWTDHLLWHHACHTVDLFAHQTGEPVEHAHGLQGPPHPELGIAMDMSIGMKAAGDALCTLSLSFNNDGPLGTVFRYICDNGTFIARYDDLFDGHEQPIDLSEVGPVTDGVELADREFIAAIMEDRQPQCAVTDVLTTMETLDRLERSLN